MDVISKETPTTPGKNIALSRVEHLTPGATAGSSNTKVEHVTPGTVDISNSSKHSTPQPAIGSTKVEHSTPGNTGTNSRAEHITPGTIASTNTRVEHCTPKAMNPTPKVEKTLWGSNSTKRRIAHSSPQITNTINRVEHITPGTTSTNSRPEHITPGTTGTKVRIAHSTPQSTTVSRRIAHSTPQNTSASKRIAHSTPQAAHATYTTPENTGKIPQSTPINTSTRVPIRSLSSANPQQTTTAVRPTEADKKITPPVAPKTHQVNTSQILDDLALSESDADSPMKPMATPVKYGQLNHTPIKKSPGSNNAFPLQPQKLFTTPQKNLCPLLPMPISPIGNTLSPPAKSMKNNLPQAINLNKLRTLKNITSSHVAQVVRSPEGHNKDNKKAPIISHQTLSDFRGSAVVKKSRGKKRISLQPAKAPMTIAVRRRSSAEQEQRIDVAQQQSINVPIISSQNKKPVETDVPNIDNKSRGEMSNKVVVGKEADIMPLLTSKPTHFPNTDKRFATEGMPLSDIIPRAVTSPAVKSQLSVNNTNADETPEPSKVTEVSPETSGKTSEEAKSKQKKKKRNRLGFGPATATPVICIQSNEKTE